MVVAAALMPRLLVEGSGFAGACGQREEDLIEARLAKREVADRDPAVGEHRERVRHT
jgi:hypothetical protein